MVSYYLSSNSGEVQEFDYISASPLPQAELTYTASSSGRHIFAGHDSRLRQVALQYLLWSNKRSCLRWTI